MTDLDLVKASADCYNPVGPWDRVWNCAGVWMFYRDGVLAFRGSKTPEDWIRDLDALPDYQSGIGFVQAGFMTGMRTAFAEWRKAYPDVSPWLTGHSLGGAHAAIMGALLMQESSPSPRALVTFGSPRPSFYKMRRLLRSGKFPMRGYANAGDPVPALPPHVALVFPYVHAERMIHVQADPDPSDTSPFAAHHVRVYVRAIEQLA